MVKQVKVGLPSAELFLTMSFLFNGGQQTGDEKIFIPNMTKKGRSNVQKSP
ncbi:hypothetical protein DFP93_11386 [Aneurinibacillus soli]|uniref:Uncharacterized protein n=1 Tax=Aneurinibacillus soli TaxID=1500254 RepID=A0A0U4WEQ0_9BACL|nr:hypothetical protein [Aneurinibacillus soli]PYE60376.1 hypothetical protein DFP93_11386 [Aneurinibacillus soli]BAU27224.1 hypothetical protein CB4_01393 [Aneurinibacillus soli]